MLLSIFSMAKLAYLKGSLKRVLASGSTLEVIGGDVLVDGALHDVHHPGCRVVAEIGHGHCRGCVDRGLKFRNRL